MWLFHLSQSKLDYIYLYPILYVICRDSLPSHLSFELALSQFDGYCFSTHVSTKSWPISLCHHCTYYFKNHTCFFLLKYVPSYVLGKHVPCALYAPNSMPCSSVVICPKYCFWPHIRFLQFCFPDRIFPRIFPV